MALGLAEHFLGKMVPSLVVGKEAPDLHFHDPFCGGGTSLLVARTQRYSVTGADLLPTAVIIARAKVNRLHAEGLAELQEELRTNPLSYRSNPLWTWPTWNTWYNRRAVRALQDIREHVFKREKRRVFSHLAVALSQTCWTVSGADPDVMVPTHSNRAVGIPRPPPGRVLKSYRLRVQRMLDAQAALDELGVDTNPVDVSQGSALDPESWPGAPDIVLTSPPYGLGLDYIRAASLQWHVLFPGISMSSLREKLVGRRSSIVRWARTLPEVGDDEWYKRAKAKDPVRLAAFMQYLTDLRQFLLVARRKLGSQGLLGLVLGDPESARVRIPLAQIARVIALDVGLEEAAPPVHDRIRRRFQAGARRSSNAPITDETLLCLRAA